MFIAHLPAGYLLARRLPWGGAARGGLVLGAIAPDFDLIWWALIDHGQVHHHRYWTHVPLTWAVLGLVAVGLYLLRPRAGRIVGALSLGALLHVILDSLVGDIMWLFPLRDDFFALATVDARYQPWWLNFVWHWSAGVELVIVAAAALGGWRRRRGRRTEGA